MNAYICISKLIHFYGNMDESECDFNAYDLIFAESHAKARYLFFVHNKSDFDGFEDIQSVKLIKKNVGRKAGVAKWDDPIGMLAEGDEDRDVFHRGRGSCRWFGYKDIADPVPDDYINKILYYDFLEETKVINPSDVIKFNATDGELEEFIIFSICVAGKGAKKTAQVVEKLLDYGNGSPFETIGDLVREDRLGQVLREIRIGQYTRLEKALTYLVQDGINLRTCSVEDLVKVPGVGPKTARYFILYTRPDQRLAALDTHILKFLKDRGYEVPKSTPQSEKAYRRVENLFLKEADRVGRSPAEFDLMIWVLYSRGNRI